MPRNVIEIKCRLFANNSHFFPLSLFPPSPLFYFRVWHASRSRPISADLLEGSRVKTFGISKGIRMCSYRGKNCVVWVCVFSWFSFQKNGFVVCYFCIFFYDVLIRWIVLREISKRKLRKGIYVIKRQIWYVIVSFQRWFGGL